MKPICEKCNKYITSCSCHIEDTSQEKLIVSVPKRFRGLKAKLTEEARKNGLSFSAYIVTTLTKKLNEQH